MICFFVLIGLVVGLLIAASILRAACHLANQDVPHFGMAMIIVFATAIIQGAVGVLGNILTGIPIVPEPNTQIPDHAPLVSLLAYLVNIPITMAVYYQLIPTTTFARAALVWLIQNLIVLGIAALIAGIIYLSAHFGVI